MSIWTNIFDCLNVKNQTGGVKKRKLFLQPYTDLNGKHLFLTVPIEL